MKRYFLAALALLMLAVWLYRLNAECEAAGDVLVRGTLKPVCVKEIQR